MRSALVVTALLVAGCPSRQSEKAPSADPGSKRYDEMPQDEPAAADEGEDEAAAAIKAESKHHVVFADRTRQAYVLLLAGADEPKAPTREELVGLVEAKLGDPKADEEVEALVKLIQTEPPPPGFAGLSDEERERFLQTDLLGLSFEVVPLDSDADDALVPRAVLEADVLTQSLGPAERKSLPDRSWALLLRADYRNKHDMRGLRLLQTLVRLVAAERDALIHDPDTAETFSRAAFAKRRLRSRLGNIAEQIAIVPFPDRTHGEGYARLSTRGMRRFGCVDLELDGLPGDPAVLAQAQHLLAGLAFRMVQHGQWDPLGYAVEADDVLEVSAADVASAYAQASTKPPQCEACPGRTKVHLVERDPLETDAAEHVVARVVAPRAASDTEGYDQRAWAHRAVEDLVGLP